VAVDGSGNVFLVDTASKNLYIETLQNDGSYVESTFALGLTAPGSLAIDGNGNLYVADSSHGEVDRLTRQPDGSLVESVARSGLTQVAALAVGRQGNLYYSQASGVVVMIDDFDPPSLTLPTTKPGVTSASSQTLVNLGNEPLVFRVPDFNTNASVGAPFSFSPGSTCPIIGLTGVASSLDVGASCVYNIGFTPPDRERFLGFVEFFVNNLNSPPGADGWGITLWGSVSSSDTTRTSLRVSPNPVKAGLRVTITVTVADTDNAAAIIQGDVTVTDTVGNQVTTLTGNGILSGGKATFMMTAAVAGTHTISAHYFGRDGSFLASTGQASLTVQP
jgi:hypothetical protein